MTGTGRRSIDAHEGGATEAAAGRWRFCSVARAVKFSPPKHFLAITPSAQCGCETPHHPLTPHSISHSRDEIVATGEASVRTVIRFGRDVVSVRVERRSALDDRIARGSPLETWIGSMVSRRLGFRSIRRSGPCSTRAWGPIRRGRTEVRGERSRRPTGCRRWWCERFLVGMGDR